MTSPAKLSCRHVWKVFGEDAARLFQGGKVPDAAALAAGGYIGAVRDASIDVYEGEIFVIMGLSGSGKSTLVRCLTRLIEPTAGAVLFDAQDLMQAGPSELIEMRRHKMGMVFQHFALLPHRTVLGNVAFPLEVQGVDRKTREDRARRMIDLVGLTGREAYYPRELSGGQQQRVGIARSLAVEPDVWFLDEPFSALDPLIRREMQDEFLRLQSVLHKTIVFITHDFDEAIRLADRIAIMKDGEIIQIGTARRSGSEPGDRLRERIHPGDSPRQGADRRGVDDTAVRRPKIIRTGFDRHTCGSRRWSSAQRRHGKSGRPSPLLTRTIRSLGELSREAVFETFADAGGAA